jgi:hypothetical protein
MCHYHFRIRRSVNYKNKKVSNKSKPEYVQLLTQLEICICYKRVLRKVDESLMVESEKSLPNRCVPNQRGKGEKKK